MEENYKLLAINPGSTSTKIAVFYNDTKIFSANIEHDADRLKKFVEISEQYPYRKEMIMDALVEEGILLEDISAFVGRGGGLASCEGGTYPVNAIMLEHAKTSFGAKHPANLGSIIANDFAETYGKTAYVVNPPSLDEFQPVARISGLASIPRKSSFHALNHKEVALRAAAEIGKSYDEVNLVIAHIGGGISIAAHKRGKAVDATDAINGDGPMAPTRTGELPAAGLISLCYSGKYTQREMSDFVTKNGGFVDHLGTSDVLEVLQRIKEGDTYAKLVFDAMIYQVGKSIGAYATVLNGAVDAIVLTGGIVRDQGLVEKITEMVSYIAPIKVYPAEFEMEALANGVLRVLNGLEQPKTYTGVPVLNAEDKY